MVDRGGCAIRAVRAPTVEVRCALMAARPPLFGLPLEEVTEIEVAGQTTHVFEAELSEDEPGSFPEVALAAMRGAASS